MENLIVGLSSLISLYCFERRAEAFDERTFNEWVDLAEAPALPASLRLYREFEQLGFKMVLLTGRSEPQRNVTEKNLVYAGYSNWERLLLRYTNQFKLILVDYLLSSLCQNVGSE